MRELKFKTYLMFGIVFLFTTIGYVFSATYRNTTAQSRFFVEDSKWIEPYDTFTTIYYTSDSVTFALIDNKNGADVVKSKEIVILDTGEMDTVNVPLTTTSIDMIVNNGSFFIWLNDTLTTTSAETSEYWALDISKTVRQIIFKAVYDSSVCEVHCMDERILTKLK